MNSDLIKTIEEILKRYHISDELSSKIVEEIKQRLLALDKNREESQVYEIYIDGGSRGNPGKGASACIIYEGNKKITAIGRFFGNTTNNEAEYNALLLALSESLKRGYKSIKVYTDSELLKKQINREYSIKSPNLIPLYKKAEDLISRLEDFSIHHIPREKNSEADRYANHIMDIRKSKIIEYAR